MTAPQTDATWDDNLLKNPHAQADKRERVRKMFAAIAPSYDVNNRLHSLWQDQRWRRKAVKLANLKSTDVVVDVACGTGDLALAFARRLIKLRRRPLLRNQVLGLDFTYEMLPLGTLKTRRPYFPGIAKFDPPLQLHNAVKFINGDAESLPLSDASADVVSIAFGIRNVQDPMLALREFRRILRPGGRVIILEFSLPSNRVLCGLYNFYFRKILPRTATWISGDKTGAYKYLPESVNTFITRERMMQMMRDAGFENVEHFPLTFGVCLCYRGFKV
jgi:demethylmenaquinone methyltransferase/2-methoxy-6-polyprenyl-1,4-benzoquinol methylase